ncbi:Serine/arginine-rich splicing factor 3 [Trichinella pseudospiralis]|uniref:Serine/arginine-rich splicing factor 3 n=1 Tax=Trichinella pseudospiralis TaxID=6337 RepID=A0A0V0Y2N9_TRIPS|nr:Serine/arginine-rich splicing factor 3 [Trichinella pseudospiralis]
MLALLLGILEFLKAYCDNWTLFSYNLSKSGKRTGVDCNIIMSNREPCPPGCKVYIGGLPQGASQDELREKFEVFGPLRHVWVARNPWGFAFVEFEDSRDAQDSIRELDQTHLCGVKVTVQLSRGRRRNSNFSRDDRYKRSDYRNERYQNRYSRRSRSPMRRDTRKLEEEIYTVFAELL